MPVILFESLRPRRLRQRLMVLVSAMIALSSCAVNAAEIHLNVAGTFNPPGPEQTARFPNDGGISRADLATGIWSMSVVYDDAAPDVDPDPYVGRFSNAIKSAQFTVGGKTLELPVDRAQIIVSDGGQGFPFRESIKVVVQASLPAGTMRLSWIQLSSQARTTDLRGPSGLLKSDALPPFEQVAQFPTTQPFDRFLELRVDPVAGESKPLLYLSSSALSATATARPATH